MDFYAKDCPTGTVCTYTEVVVFDWNRILDEIDAAGPGEAGQGVARQGKARQGKANILLTEFVKGKDYEEFINNQASNTQRHSRLDVRPICGGQQDRVGSGKEDVFRVGRSEPDDAIGKYNIPADGAKYTISPQKVFRQKGLQVDGSITS